MRSRFGYWLAIMAAVLGSIYLLAIIAAILFDSIPPHEPYQSVIGVVSILSVPALVLLWVIISESVPADKKVFAYGSLALMVIFGTLTSINRYVSLTVVPQAVQLGQTEGLDWFQPYGWPSIMAAMEVLAWGFYLGLAFFCLAPVFTSSQTHQGRPVENGIFWVLIVNGVFCLIAMLGQVFNSILLNVLGILAWGPGLISLLALLAVWFKQQTSNRGS